MPRFVLKARMLLPGVPKAPQNLQASRVPGSVFTRILIPQQYCSDDTAKGTIYVRGAITTSGAPLTA
eukprot:534613-Rhodomonas_salina.1